MKEVKEKRYSNGELMYRYNCLNNKPHGLAKWWWNNGELEWRHNHVNGKECGLGEYWYGNGKQAGKDYRLI